MHLNSKLKEKIDKYFKSITKEELIEKSEQFGLAPEDFEDEIVLGVNTQAKTIDEFYLDTIPSHKLERLVLRGYTIQKSLL